MIEIIKQTNVNGYFISTVLPPDTNGLYETMIFETDNNNKVIDWSEIYYDHYETKQEALKNHDILVKKWFKIYENNEVIP